MKLADVSQATARLALVNEKCRSALEEQLRKWFSTQFVKSASLKLLRSVYQSGAYAEFAQLLTEATDAERAAILTKVDKHRPEIQMRSKAEIMRHLETLASGSAEAAEKPRSRSKSKASKPAKKSVNIISNSKY